MQQTGSLRTAHNILLPQLNLHKKMKKNYTFVIIWFKPFLGFVRIKIYPVN